MEQYRNLSDTQIESHRKQFRCIDCGNSYFIANSQKSSKCDKCGNIHFHGVKALAGVEAKTYPQLNFLQHDFENRSDKSSFHAIYAKFQMPLDQNKIEHLLNRYQVEWQLWAVLNQNFDDPEYHAAYISIATLEQKLIVATTRYGNHLTAMANDADYFWQAEIAEAMINKILAISTVRMEAESKMVGLAKRMGNLNWDPRVFRLAYFLLGFFGVIYLFSRG